MEDLDLYKLPFHLFVAGELEIVLGRSGTKEKWSRLNMLRQLAYKAQFLPHRTIIDTYVAFLRKFEKGKVQWGAEKAIADLESNLRFRILNLQWSSGAGNLQKWVFTDKSRNLGTVTDQVQL